jgi:hypothetical protein
VRTRTMAWVWIENSSSTRMFFCLALACLLALGGCDAPKHVAGASIARLTTSDWPSPIVRLDTALTPSDPLAAGQFGVRVAISGDLLVAAAPSTNLDGAYTAGGAYVFERDAVSGVWTELTKLVPAGASDQWSFSVAVDGDTIVLGTPYRNMRGLQEGAIHVFGRHQGGTDQWGEVKRISGAALGSLAQFGTSLVLSGDLLIVGAADPPDTGYVQVFERNRGGPDAWGLVTNVSYQDGGLGPEYFGASLALDGDLLLVGSTSADVSDYASNDGAAFLFQRDPINRDAWNFVARFTEPEAVRCTGGLTLWEMPLQSAEEQQAWQDCLAADSSTANAGFGGSVTVSGDTAVVGGRGAAYVFRRDPSNSNLWPQVAKLENDDSVGYGRLLLQGDRLYAGSSGAEIDSAPARGAVHVLDRDPGSGVFNRVETLIAADGLSDDYFGNSIAVSGNTRVIAAYGRAGYRGAVYVQQAVEPEPTEPPGCQPARTPTDTLEAAASVVRPSGFALAAPAGTLAAPQPIWIEEVAAPDEPMLLGASVSGSYYNVGAQCTTQATAGTHFVVTLPVPPSANTTRLAVAALVPASGLHDGAESGSVWLPLTGGYDAARAVYSVAVTGLSHEGVTFALIEDSSVVAPPAESARVFGSFWVGCFGLGAQICGPRQQSDVSRALHEALVVFRQQGFPDPYVTRRNPLDPFTAFEPYPAQLVPSWSRACVTRSGGTAKAFYSTGTGTLYFCIDPVSGIYPTAELRGYARHELFHAIQYAFPNVLNNAPSAWVMEGTAVAAMGWDGLMHRASGAGAWSLRSVDVGLATEALDPATAMRPYEAQDFWVHLFRSTSPNGGRRNLPLGELVSFFERGASTQSVADRFENPATLGYGTLSNEYWAWVKNQAYERTDVDFDGALTDPCKLGPEAGSPTLHTYVQPADSSAENEVVVSFETGMQARAVQIDIPTSLTTGLDNATFAVEGGADVRYKIYHVEGDPLIECSRDNPDGESRTFAHLDPGAHVVVLTANAAHADDSVLPPLVKVTIRTP